MARSSEIRDLDTRMAERRARGGAIRDLGRDGGRAADPTRPAFLSPTGWLVALIANIALVLVIGLAVVLVPPLLDCREQGARGYFAGDSFGACAGRGIAARFERLDARLRQAVLRSGR